MNLGDFRTRISGEIGLSNKDGSTEQAVIDSKACEAVIWFLRKTKCYVLPWDMALTADEGDYELPTSVLAFKDLYVVSASGSTVDRPLLDPVSGSEIIRRRRYPSAAGAPQAYALEGANLLMIHPNAASSSDALQGLYIPRPTKMTDAAHDSSDATYGGIPSEFDEALAQRALQKAAEWDDDTSSQVGLSYRSAALEELKDAMIALNTKGGRRWPAARPKRRRGYIPYSPGVDTGR